MGIDALILNKIYSLALPFLRVMNANRTTNIKTSGFFKDRQRL